MKLVKTTQTVFNLLLLMYCHPIIITDSIYRLTDSVCNFSKIYFSKISSINDKFVILYLIVYEREQDDVNEALKYAMSFL